MFNYQDLNDTQTKEFSRYLLDISKACIVGIIAANAISDNITIKIASIFLNLFFALFCLEVSMTLLKKLK